MRVQRRNSERCATGVVGVHRFEVELAETRAERRRGLLGRTTFDGCLLLQPCRSIHSIGMRFPIDVVYLACSDPHGSVAIRRASDAPPAVTQRYRVISVHTVVPNRVGLPRLKSVAVLELPAGRSQVLGLAAGVEFSIQESVEANSYVH